MMKEALDRLFRRQNFGIKLGLELQEALQDGLGNPEEAYGVIHVAGTNGKGSVCACLESILRQAGYRTGLYTSPHLVRFNERFKVNGKAIGNAELAALVARIEEVTGEVEKALGRPATFFECGTALAFEYFRQAGVEIAIVETGMGGRLDATNVVVPVLSVITRISLEHTQHLGNTLAAIAGEKAGIVKRGRPVVAGAMAAEALAAIRKRAEESESLLVEADQYATVTLKELTWKGQKVGVETGNASYGAIRTQLLGVHQLENVATAVTAAELLNDLGVPVPPEAIKKGLAQAEWVGRCQVLESDPPLVIDGAHNPGAAMALAATLKKLLGRQPLALVCGMCADKDARSFFAELQGLVKACWTVTLQTERSVAGGELARQATGLGCPVQTAALPAALAAARTWARENGGAVCVAGSLFLVGEVLELREKEDGK